MADFSERRERMVERQIRRRGVTNAEVLRAMREVPREVFVPADLQEFAYEDSPLPIEAGQTISQPFIVAAMIDIAEISPGDTVLEIGLGSGYAAAVISRIAARVYAIERHGDLTQLARQRMQRLAYGNIEIRTGDGTGGWPEAAPFDAIIASAGGPAVPQVLKEQLDIGGVLVMPVGRSAREQRLVKIRRLGANHFDEEDMGAVSFVPLIGAHGWPGAGDSADLARAKPARPTPQLIAEAAEELPEIDSPLFAQAFDRYADARVVLLGECTHGTAEFYRARAAITRRLIEQHGFNVVAVEADWPDAASIDRYVRDRGQGRRREPAFQRFPTWMWRNVEVEAFTEELRDINLKRAAEERVGFYGLDLYSLGASIRAVLDYLDRIDPEAAAIARKRYGCLTPWAREPQLYGRMAISSGYAKCEAPVVQMLGELLEKQLEYAAKDGDDFLDAAANARLVMNAEAYYRVMYYGAAESWNLRDRHMFETLRMILDAKGPNAKAVVWAHNSHIGDASKTDMGLVREELNIGQLARERWGKDAALIGFGTHAGTVACASDWDGPAETKQINPSRPDSVERLAHDSRIARFLLDIREGHAELRERLSKQILQRFIGVIYRPDSERWSHYSHCALAEQYDGYVWFDETTAVTALPAEQRAGVPDTYPFGL